MNRSINLLIIAIFCITSTHATPVTWDGNNAAWLTASEWTPDQVPNISGGSDTATINAGTITWVPGGEWANNSTVTINSNAVWTQTVNSSWIRIAGNGSGNTGVLVLNDNATFNAGTAGRIVIGMDGGIGTVIVNDNSSLDANGQHISLGYLEGSQNESSGTLDINGGTVTANEFWFSRDDWDSDWAGVDTYGRVNISDGILEATQNGVSIWFWNIGASGYDHAVNFDGSGGSVITRGEIRTEAGNGIIAIKSWEDLFNEGFLLRNNSGTGSFSDHFAVQDLGDSDRRLMLKNVVWGGGSGEWSTATNWINKIAPDIHSAFPNSVTINAGTTTWVPGGDWANNSTVTINSNAVWTQSGNGSWIRIAGDGSGNTGVLVLNDNATFNAGTAGKVLIGMDGGTGTVSVSDNAELDTDGGDLVLGYLENYQNASAGTLDINGGTVTANEFWFSRMDTGSEDWSGVDTYGRLNISGGTLEATSDYSITFWNISASGYDHNINFDGSDGSIITRGLIRTETTGTTTEKSWETLFNEGRLLRNGSNDGTFDQHFKVTDLGSGDLMLKLRSTTGTIIIIN